MRHYEVVLLVHPDQSDQLSDMLKRYQDSVTKNGGKIHRIEDIGRLQLAYTIKDMHKAHYVLMNIECDNQTLSEIESSFGFNDSIMRHLVVKMDNAVTEPSKLFLVHSKDKDSKKADTKVSGKDSKVRKNTVKLAKDKDKAKAKDQEESIDLDVKSTTDLNDPDMQISATQQEENDDEKVQKSEKV